MTEPTALAYPITVNCAGLTQGRYETTIRVSSDRGTVTDVRVIVDVNAQLPPVFNAGRQYVVALDAATFETKAATVVTPFTQGAFAYTLSGLRPGTYYVVSGTDNDYDGFICDVGEACGGYPQLTDLRAVTIAGSNIAIPVFVTGYSSLAKRATDQAEAGLPRPAESGAQ